MQNVDIDNLSEAELNELMIKEEQGMIIQQEQPKDEKPIEQMQEPETTEQASVEVSEEIEPEPTKVFDKKHDPVAGLKREMLAERERRRQAELKLKEFEDRLNSMSAFKKPDEVVKDEYSGMEDDDVASVKLVRDMAMRQKALEDRLARQEAEAKALKELEKQQQISRTEKETRGKYSAEKVGQEYSYETILAEEIEPMLAETPEYADIIRSSRNPAETAYKLGLARRLDVNTVFQPKAIPQQAKKPLPKTLGGLPSGGGTSGEISVEALKGKDLGDLTDEEFEKVFITMR
jgi:hypothetical protein